MLLLYPDSLGDYGTETFYAFVSACDPIEAVARARNEAAAAQTGVEIEPEDFHRCWWSKATMSASLV